MGDEIAIKVDGVSKNFKLPHEKHNSLKSKIVHMFKGTKGYQTQHALKDISFEIKKGEFFGIVGRNGSGKSTLLKLLAGIYQPTEGKVSVQGKLVPFIELGVGFNPELTGRENVFLNGALLRFDNNEIAKMYDEIVEFAELERFMDQKLKNYSSGMQVRLAFSMAVRAKADILLIDEVLAVGDADFQRKCFDYFKRLKKEKKTVVFVSHDMGAIKDFCDKALLINKAQVVDKGNPNLIADKYAQLFLTEGNETELNRLALDDRIGSGTVAVVSSRLSKSTYMDTDKMIVIRVKISARDDLDSLVIGFAIKDSLGNYITSTHSWDALKELISVKSKKVYEVVWDVPNIYEDGRYTVDLYMQSQNGEVFDRVNEAITFRVKRPYKSGALVVTKVDMRMTTLDSGITNVTKSPKP